MTLLGIFDVEGEEVSLCQSRVLVKSGDVSDTSMERFSCISMNGDLIASHVTCSSGVLAPDPSIKYCINERLKRIWEDVSCFASSPRLAMISMSHACFP